MRTRILEPLSRAFLLFLLFAYAMPCIAADRGRPVVAKNSPVSGFKFSTIVSDRGTLLRGPRWSTDIFNCALPVRGEVTNLRNLGFNSLHLYAEAFSVGPPAGYCMNAIDTLVEWTSQDGLYLILTIGNGTQNGTYNSTFATNFWNLYAPRYKDRTHVIYEIQNEPYYASGQSQPSPASLRAFERDRYLQIRGLAPNTPILLFSYAVFRSGSAVLADIQALSPDVNWSNAGIAFHGYAPTLLETENTLTTVLAQGYPCMQTEFYQGLENGQQVYKQDVPLTLMHEDRYTSWLTFLDVHAAQDNTKYKTPLDTAWAVWAADFGTWPATASPPVGHVVRLKAWNNLFVTAPAGGLSPLVASAASVGTPERFSVVASGEGTFVGLIALANNKYVSAENAGATYLIADRTQLAQWERFEWLKRPDNTVALRARANNRIVSADLNLTNPPQLIANRKAAGPWERFTVTVE